MLLAARLNRPGALLTVAMQMKGMPSPLRRSRYGTATPANQGDRPIRPGPDLTANGHILQVGVAVYETGLHPSSINNLLLLIITPKTCC